MKIEITAFDTLFFRDGKPFSMGDDTWATGIFPPPPSVFFGMLRTAYASQNKISLRNIVKETKDLKIKSLFLKFEDNLIFPYPADLFSTKELAKNNNAKILRAIENNTISNIEHADYSYLLTTNKPDKVKEFFGKAFLSNEFSDFTNYLNNINTEIEYVELKNISFSEPKIGIGKDIKTNITSEGKLYRVGMQRLENRKGKRITFILEFEGLENLKFAEEGFLKLGAENKAAYYRKCEINTAIKCEISSKFVKLYLATPAIFNSGSEPEFIKKKQSENGIKFELLTQAIGKPIHIGGFDMQADNGKGGKGYPKPMKKAVPAGSVYYLKTNNPKELVDELNGKSISEDLKEQGFGICYCGTFKI